MTKWFGGIKINIVAFARLLSSLKFPDKVFSMLESLMHAISSSSMWLLLGCIAAIYAGIRKSLVLFTIILLIIASAGFCDLTCTYWLKPWIAHFGDCQLLKLVQLTISSCGAEFGLPSAHAADAMAAATIVIWTTRGASRSLAVMIAILIGMSRVYLGVHVPIDIVTAFAIGMIVGSLIFGLWHVLTKKATKLLEV